MIPFLNSDVAEVDILMIMSAAVVRMLMATCFVGTAVCGKKQQQEVISGTRHR